VLKAPTLGFAAAAESVSLAQSVFAGQVASVAVVRFAVDADCTARGIVTITLDEIDCRRESDMSAAVPVVPVLVVT
jgi:hypothetical protein